MDDVLLNSNHFVHPVVLEYGFLATRKFLTHREADRLTEILEQASVEPKLHFLLMEIDHILGHELGFLTPSDRHSYANQQARLREYLTQGRGSCDFKIATNP